MNKIVEQMAIINYGSDYKNNPPGEKYPVYGTGGIMGYTSVPLDNGPAVLSGRKGSINNPIYVDTPFWNVDTIFSIKAKEEVDTKWLYYNFCNTDLRRLNEATGVPSVSSKALYKLSFKYFDYPIQLKIAEILTICDSVIEKTEAAIAKYNSIKQGMLQDLFTRGIDLKTDKLRSRPEDAPKLYKESELGLVPIEWDAIKIGEILHTIMSNVDKHVYEDEKKILLCNYMDVYTNRYITNNIDFMNGSVSLTEEQKFSLQPEDVVITKDSETPDDIAVPSVIESAIDNLICGYHLCILKEKIKDSVYGPFLMHQLLVFEINRQFAIRANGSTRFGLTINSIQGVFSENS